MGIGGSHPPSFCLGLLVVSWRWWGQLGLKLGGLGVLELAGLGLAGGNEVVEWKLASGSWYGRVN